MADLLRIKNNVAKMVQQGAPESDIDTYIKLEGASVNAIKNIKLSRQNLGLISSMAGISPQQLAERGNWIKSGLLQTAEDIYREGISPFVAGSSTLALGIPRQVARQTGVEQLIYPEQQTLIGKGIRLPSEIYGLLGGGAAKGAGLAIKGAERFIPKLVGKGLTRGIIRGGLGAGTFGLLQQPPEGKTRLQQAKEFAAYGATIPIAGAGLNKIGQIATKTGRWVARDIGGVTDATVATIKRLGANRVFDPLKAKADYISQNIAPRIYEKLNKFVDFADDAYKNAVNKFKGNSINSQPFYQEIQRGLRQKGWIDLRGNPTTDYKSGLDPIADKLTTLYLRIKAPEEGAKLFGKIMSKEDFFTYRDALTSMLREKPSDRLVMQARNALYNSAEKSGMTGIKLARDLEKKVFDIENKIDIKKITSDLVKSKNPQWSKVIQKEYEELANKGIINKQDYQNIFDDLMAHFANIDFELVSETPGAGGGFTPTRARFLQKGIGEVAKQYYQNIRPRTQPVTSRLQEALEKIISMQK